MINVQEELNKINDLIKANGKLTAKDRNAIPQMEMPAREPKARARMMDEVALGFSKEQAMVRQRHDYRQHVEQRSEQRLYSFWPRHYNQ